MSAAGRLFWIAALLVTGPAWLVSSIAHGQRGTSGEDYLGPELRSRVEKLKLEVAESSDSPEVLLSRLRTLWEWSNAYALTGGPIPVDYPSGVAACQRRLRGFSGGAVALERANQFIRQYVREFQIKDEDPRALGTLSLSDTGPFQVEQYVTIEETYTVGRMQMRPGGGILVGQSTRWASRAVGALRTGVDQDRDLRIQADAPAAAGYVTVRCSNPDASFRLARPWGRWRGFNLLPAACFRLEGAALVEGDTITVTFGDTSGGGPGLRLQHWSNDRVLLPVLVDLEGSGHMLTPKWPSFGVVGAAETRRVTAIVSPAVVAVGEPFELAVRSEDRYKNPISGNAPAYEILLDNRVLATVPAAANAVSLVRDLKVDSPGVYRFIVRSKDGRLTTRSNPVWMKRRVRDRIYFGDTHGHSGMADGQGSADGYYRFARDVARLDFVTLSEHDLWMDDFEWLTLKRMTRQYLDRGRFTPMLGYEWTANSAIGGHHNVYFRDPEGRRRVGVQDVVNVDELYADLRKVHQPEDVLIIPHAHNPGDWTKHDADMQRLAEITSGHGSFEWYGNRFLENGFEVGFVGSSDDHTGHPGYHGMVHTQMGGLAAVIAEANTPEAVFDALRARRTYATTGERILLEVGLGGASMGQRALRSDRREITCRVMGTEPLDTIDVVKNGRVVYSRRCAQSGLRPQVWVQVLMQSSSEVFTYDRPRNTQYWRGSLEVRGARLTDFKAPWFANPTQYVVRRDEAADNRLTFFASTHGRGKGLLLQLEDVDEATEIVVDFEPVGRADRSPAGATGQHRFRLASLPGGLGVRELGDGRNVDRLEVQLLPAHGTLDDEFRYLDRDNPQPGDYYYVRVRQVDGGMAWSSPIWVGRRTSAVLPGGRLTWAGLPGRPRGAGR